MKSESIVSTKQEKIAELARIHPEVSFSSLAYHIDLGWLNEAYQITRKDGATGVDGQTAEEYAKDLESNLKSLLERAKSGRYKAPPVKRVHIPKGKGKEMRPIGIPTFEDKVLQKAVKMLLEPLFEHDFLDCSYGFRPGISAHMALESLWKDTMDMRGGWIIDLDIRKYFDSVDHSHLREILKSRVCDGVIVRLIGKWLKAGVMENGYTYYPDGGTPQGGVISPLMSNIYLHEVLDKWIMEKVRPLMKGKICLTRYADDAVIGFTSKEDAQKVMKVLPKRFEKYGLTLHPEKTRLINFNKPEAKEDDHDNKHGKSFDFLGFTHYWGKSRKGNWTVKRKTIKSRFAKSLHMIKAWCKVNRHMEVKLQHKKLVQKIIGHYAYYGITGNFRMLSLFRNELLKIWKKWLNKRSRENDMSWNKFNQLLKRYPIPRPKIYHSYCTAKL